MSILFSAVARGTLVLAKSASCPGNFSEVTKQVLSQIPSENNKLTYSSNNYLFHYVVENKLVYFCITDSNYPRQKTFLFLNEIKKRFLASFQDIPPDALPYAAMRHQENDAFSGVLESEMLRFNNSKAPLPVIKAELDELKNIMVKSVEKLALRGERLETLVNRADDLEVSTTSFNRNAVQVQRKYWWKNIRMYVIIAVVSVPIVYFIGAAACGGLKWQKFLNDSSYYKLMRFVKTVISVTAIDF